MIQGFEKAAVDPTASEGWKPFSDRKLRVGIIGYGVCKFGSAFSFQDHPNVEIVAVSDLFSDRCAALAKECRCTKIYLSLAGLQMHSRVKDGMFCDWLGKTFDFQAFDAMLKLYEQNGVDVHITEFDIHLPPASAPADFELQGKCHAEVLRHAIASPRCEIVQDLAFHRG